MATTFDVNRIGGGTFELVQDPTTGKYIIKQVGFTPVKKLTLPDYTTAGSTAGTTDTSKATTEATTQTLTQQTTEAFKPAGGGEAIDYTGSEMLSQAQLQKEAKKIDPQVDTSTTTLGIARPTMRDIAGDTTEQQKQETPYQDAIMRGSAGVKAAERTVPGIIVDRKAPTRPEYSFTRPSGIDAPMTTKESALGISRVAPSATRTAKEADFASGVYKSGTDAIKSDTDAIMRGATGVKYQEPTLSVQANTAFKKINTGLKALANSVGSIIDPILKSSPIIGALDALTTPETITQKHDKQYFTDRGDGRIGGNPATDLYAGFNRVSKTGNLEAAGDKRIETREATIERKGIKSASNPNGVSQSFVDNTNKMKDQAKDYKQSVRSSANNVPPSQRGGGGDPGCFIKGTLITMLDGSKKPVEQVDLGDNVAVGGKVFAVGKFLNTELYDYKGIKVSGSHMVNEDGVWLRVRDTKHGKSLGNDLNTVYVFGSENRRILINDILFTDYFEVNEQDQLINNEEDFFNNWKTHAINEDINNVNILNAN